MTDALRSEVLAFFALEREAEQALLRGRRTLWDEATRWMEALTPRVMGDDPS